MIKKKIDKIISDYYSGNIVRMEMYTKIALLPNTNEEVHIILEKIPREIATDFLDWISNFDSEDESKQVGFYCSETIKLNIIKEFKTFRT